MPIEISINKDLNQILTNYGAYKNKSEVNNNDQKSHRYMDW